ncbi:3777_t:CDS:1, partial [Funneliformis caledonium]
TEDSLIEEGSLYPIKEGSSSSNIDPYNENIEEVVPLTKYDLYISSENKEDHDINKRRRVDRYQKSNKKIIDQHEIPSDYSGEEGSVDEEMTLEDDGYMPNEDDLFTTPSFDDFDYETTSYTNLDYDNFWILL